MGTGIEDDTGTGIEGNGRLRVSKSREREGRVVGGKCTLELRRGGERVVGENGGGIFEL